VRRSKVKPLAMLMSDQHDNIPVQKITFKIWIETIRTEANALLKTKDTRLHYSEKIYGRIKLEEDG
jgi:hypothetical protein